MAEKDQDQLLIDVPSKPLLVATSYNTIDGNESADGIVMLSDIDESFATATIPSSMINLLNTVLGAGMLALPAAFASIGLIPGLLAICFFGSIASFGLHLLTICGAYIGRSSSFNSVSKITFPGAAIFFDLAIAVKCFGVGVSYLVIIGDLMPYVVRSVNHAIHDDNILVVRQFWITAFMALIAPLSFFRKLDSLKYTSFVALTAVLYLVVLTVATFFDPELPAPPPGSVKLFDVKLSFLKNLPVFVFAFTCHQNIFSVFNELKRNTQSRIDTVSYSVIFISTVIYCVFGSVGYMMFGEKVLDNILGNFQKTTWVTIARLLFTILVALSFPLQCHPSRASFDKFWNRFQVFLNKVMAKERVRHGAYSTIEANDDSNYDSQDSADSSTVLAPPFGPGKAVSPVHNIPQSSNAVEEMDSQRFNSITIGILACAYIIAFFVSDLSTVLGFVGSTGSTTICFILPGVFYLKLKEADRWGLKKIMALFLVITGALVMPICLTFTFISLK